MVVSVSVDPPAGWLNPRNVSNAATIAAYISTTITMIFTVVRIARQHLTRCACRPKRIARGTGGDVGDAEAAVTRARADRGGVCGAAALRRRSSPERRAAIAA